MKQGELPAASAAEVDTAPVTTAQRRDSLRTERRRVQRELDALGRDFDSIVSEAEGNPPDDEHDPSGATIGFERAQVTALIAMLEQRRTDIDAALERVDAGTYGRCERCGAAISGERLDAQPTATTCITCAASRSPRRR